MAWFPLRRAANSGKSKVKLLSGRLTLDPDFLLAKDGKTPVTAEYERPENADVQNKPKHAQEEVRKAWSKQDFVIGWIGFNEGGFIEFRSWEEGKSGDLPAFLTATPGLTSFLKLPAPDLKFGILVMSPVEASKLEAKDIKALGAMKHLELLTLNNVRIPDGSIKTLAGAKGLRQLYLVKTKLDDAAISDLSMFSELQKLSLNDNERVTNASLKEIGKLKRLRWLSLGHTQVTDLNEIAGLEQLESLFVPGTKIKDASLDNLVNLKKLSELYLGGSGVTDAGLKSVSGIKQLQVLSLNATRVTDEGLKSLASLKKLKKLSLLNTQVTDGGVLMLKQALPELRIEH